MIIIGEKLNSTIKSVRTAIEERNEAFVANLANAQANSGAAYIDCNAAMLADEAESLLWLSNICASATSAPICLDSPDSEVIAYVLERNNRCKMINSVTLEQSRFDGMSTLAKKYNTALIALGMDGDCMPESAEEKIQNATTLYSHLTEYGISPDAIYIDALVSPIGAVETAGADALEVIRMLRAKLDCHLTCGLSNISFGLPARKYVNRAMLISAMTCGLDSAICDPLDSELMRLVLAQEALLGIDEYCGEYIDAYRDGKFE